MDSSSPEALPGPGRTNLHLAVMLKYKRPYYRFKNEPIEILSFFQKGKILPGENLTLKTDII